MQNIKSREEEINNAFDYAKKLALEAYATRKVLRMSFRVTFAACAATEVDSDISEGFYEP